MKTLIDRPFIVHAPLQMAWDHLANVTEWPSWAPHIRRIELTPEGPVGPDSSGKIHLKAGPTTSFKMTEFNPPQNWQWVGPFMGLTLHYDHRFRAVDDKRTELRFIVKAEGFGVSLAGPLFARVYNRNLNVAIPRLIGELNKMGEGY